MDVLFPHALLLLDVSEKHFWIFANSSHIHQHPMKLLYASRSSFSNLPLLMMLKHQNLVFVASISLIF